MQVVAKNQAEQFRGVLGTVMSTRCPGHLWISIYKVNVVQRFDSASSNAEVQ